MVLDTNDRGQLERSIDIQIKGIPLLISSFRDQDVKKFFQYKDENDVVFGMVFGSIIEKFGFYYNGIHNTDVPPADVASEVLDVIMRRAREIKEAIFKCG